MAGKKDDWNDEKSSWIFDDDDNATDMNDGFTSELDPGAPGYGGGATGVTRALEGQNDKTVVVGAEDDDKTIIDFGEIGEEGQEVSDDPVVGWLVIVKGPGIGNSINLGMGMNAVGRDTDQRAAFPYGDKQISGEDHLRIIYDDEGRTFMIAPGSGKTVSRLNGKIIAMATELPNYSTIALSKATSVRFVAFCNESFDWSDVAAAGAK